MQYSEPVHILYMYAFFPPFYFTGESLFRSFFPLESNPFFFLFARSRSRGSRESSGMWGLLMGLRGLMVPGRRGRTMGDGARTGVASLSTASAVSVVTWGEKRWGGVGAWGSALQMKQHSHAAHEAGIGPSVSSSSSFCLHALHVLYSKQSAALWDLCVSKAEHIMIKWPTDSSSHGRTCLLVLVEKHVWLVSSNNSIHLCLPPARLRLWPFFLLSRTSQMSFFWISFDGR